MELKIISETENPLFNRKEIEGEIETDVAPSREDVRKVISEKFSANSENIKVRTIMGKFGSRVFVIVANIYDSKENLDKYEIKKKKDAESEKKATEATKAEPAQEVQSSDTSQTPQQQTSNESLTTKENPEPKGEAK
ncbi:MAG: hypothetical protein ABIA78_04275 [archaeon]